MLAPLLALAAAAAPAASSDLAGLWEGRVGDLPVRACFTRREWGTFGAYYYLSRLRVIGLTQDDGGGAFREGGGADPNRPGWSIERVDGATLTARWTNRGRTLPVRLHRLARMERDESPCASLAFHRPRLAGVRMVTSRPRTDGIAYTRFTLDPRGRFEVHFETFALDGQGAAVRRINAELARDMIGDPPPWFGCIRDSLGDSAFEGEADEMLTPTMISSRWLAVTHHWDGFCGGAHPDSSNVYRTFDLTSGREIDLHDWLNGDAVNRLSPEGGGEEIKTLRPALRDLILANWDPGDADCADSVRNEDFWTIGLDRGGLVFSPQLPHVVQACGDDFTVSLARLRPFLTQAGAENLRALAAEARRPAGHAPR
jgi:hypothetical protein